MMITVNLRPGLKRKAAGGGPKQLFERVKGLATKVKDPFLVGSVAACIGVAAFLGWAFITTTSQLNALAPRLEQARDEQKRFDNLLRQKHRAELIRDSLLAQISTIRGVDGNRYIWPHIMDEVAKALPPYTWLTSMATSTAPAVVADTADTASRPLVFRLEGRTMDLQAYTRFLRQLEASPWVSEVTPLEAKTIIEKDRPVTQFTIQAQFQRADSAYIRTVPLNQSVR
ncbi:MAG TPA: PilN domain-containing protein [Gemmatimonadales bacterium]|nr:PilN domain-containing protein [Gemmatimonadales bacterium]